MKHITKILIVGLVVVMLGTYIDTPKTESDGSKSIGLGIAIAGACIGLGLAARKGGDE